MSKLQKRLEAYKASLLSAKYDLDWAERLLPGSLDPKVTQSAIDFHKARIKELEGAIKGFEEALTWK